MSSNPEPVTPTNIESTLRPSFFPPSFAYGNGNYLRPDLKRRNSSSSGANDDSSMTDENASSEGSGESTAPRRRVSFLLGDEDGATDYRKREKISHRRMSAPAFPSTPPSSSAYDTAYGGMYNAGNMNWLFPSPLTNPLLSYQDLLHRMDTRPYMTAGLMSPIFPGYSPGGMYLPYSPSPLMKRAASFPNVNPTGDPSMLYPGMTGMMGDNVGLTSPTVHMHGYDPFSYFMSNPLSSRRHSSAESSFITTSSEGESLERGKDEDEQTSKAGENTGWYYGGTSGDLRNVIQGNRNFKNHRSLVSVIWQNPAVATTTSICVHLVYQAMS